MNYCPNCGSRLALRVPPGDTLPRHVCDACGSVHYRNPLLVIGSIPEFEDRILLCRRAIEPRLGLWTLPAGFMELGETTAEAAVRETLEEANARVQIGDIFSLLCIPKVDQVHIFYRARLLDTAFSAGSESLEVALFREADIPWSELAFRSISTTLRHFCSDRRAGVYQMHCGVISLSAERS